MKLSEIKELAEIYIQDKEYPTDVTIAEACLKLCELVEGMNKCVLCDAGWALRLQAKDLGLEIE